MSDERTIVILSDEELIEQRRAEQVARERERERIARRTKRAEAVESAISATIWLYTLFVAPMASAWSFGVSPTFGWLNLGAACLAWFFVILAVVRG